MTTDAHLHPSALRELSQDGFSELMTGGRRFCASCHLPEELDMLERSGIPRNAAIAGFGIHPQAPEPCLLPFLEACARSGRIGAIGECGLDFREGRKDEALQMSLFRFQVSLAAETGLPLVLHCRSAMDGIFALSKPLARVKAVIFHSWPGSPGEAAAFLDRGVNMFFSFGGAMFNGKKSAVASCAALPEDRLLAETDAPWQPLGGKTASVPSDIDAVLRRMAEIRDTPPETLALAVNANFARAFGGDFDGIQ